MQNFSWICKFPLELAEIFLSTQILEICTKNEPTLCTAASFSIVESFRASFWVGRSFVQFLGSFLKIVDEKALKRMFWDDLELFESLRSLNVYVYQQSHIQGLAYTKEVVCLDTRRKSDKHVSRLVVGFHSRILIFLRNLRCHEENDVIGIFRILWKVWGSI